MIEKSITCPLCNHTFNPTEHLGCTNCPLHKDCIMICCPSCGYSIIQEEKSTLAKWSSRLFSNAGKDAKQK